ncbi:MAG: aspartate-semialdehyde dehydrogenase [Planctomycetota bacterium]|nr:aspartate-semialdehyde dehydrogenase [Planctomycetota bacterium]MDA1106663.1 aspartate-semialdehyde dehydrogenase [Planctomycetota bacterium]
MPREATLATERRPLTVAVIGATGVVGQETLSVLSDRSFPVGTLRPMASGRSAGQRVVHRGKEWTIEALPDAASKNDEGSGAKLAAAFAGCDVVLLAVSKELALRVAPAAAAAGAIVVDNSSAFRMDPATPLVIPEVNEDALAPCRAALARGEGCIVANPNCSTILALVAVTPIHRLARVKRMVVATYQAASGAGLEAMRELESQARSFAKGDGHEAWDTRYFGRPYLFNVFSHDSAMGADGMNEEERKLVLETRRIWRDDTVGVSATCVRVPVLRAHSEAINLTLERAVTLEEVRAALVAAPGVCVLDDPAKNQFPEPRLASGRDETLVGRLRMDASQPEGHGVSLFLAGDQLRKGAALNAVQIAECLLPSIRR